VPHRLAVRYSFDTKKRHRDGRHEAYSDGERHRTGPAKQDFQDEGIPPGPDLAMISRSGRLSTPPTKWTAIKCAISQFQFQPCGSFTRGSVEHLDRDAGKHLNGGRERGRSNLG